QTESSFRPDAVSSAGSKGLMQLIDATARSLGVADSFDPAENMHTLTINIQ
ncbi:MAG: lytic transglycosylase domain-containing protein, partial [Bryobacteraceae bacterium]|nr:lytic transglycosylase domain-containing protein [Bryobacteraceae bacterium]